MCVISCLLSVDKRNRIFRAEIDPANSRRPLVIPHDSHVRTQVPQPLPKGTSRKSSFADIHLRAIERAAPPSVIIDANADILHTSESAVRFLRLGGGELSRNLLTLILPELRLELRTTLFQVQHSNAVIHSHTVSI
jgi:two-component system CheB/CheR fusion protein